MALGTDAGCSALQRSIMLFYPESVPLNIFIGNFDEEEESLNMKLGNSA